MNLFKTLRSIFSIGKKALLVVTVLFVTLSLFAYFLNKDKPTITTYPLKNNREEIYKVLNNPKLRETKQGKLMVSSYRALTCVMIGEACTDNPEDADKYYKKSLFAGVTKLITLPYVNPPASGTYWVISGLQNAGFIPKSYAAEGIGFAALRPFMNIWKIFRDVAYMILVLILIIIGFMIMFRMKLNPQTVISVENALPRIVISLLLITFSFAIAGFLIDLMYVIIILSISVLSNRGNFFDATEFQNRYANPGFGQIWMSMFPSSSTITVLSGAGGLMTLSNSLINLLPDVLNQLIRLLLGGAGVVLFINILNHPALNILDAVDTLAGTIPVGQTITSVIEIILKIMVYIGVSMFGFGFGYAALPLVLFILVGVTILFMLFRIFFLLLSAYIRIVLMIIFSPIFLMFEALPGKSVLAFWFKNLTAEILTFPLIVIIFIVGYIMVNTTANTGTLWMPPFLADINPNAMSVLLGMGLIFMIPDLVKIFKELIGAKGLPASISLGTFFGGVGAAWGGTQAGVGMFSSLTQMPVLGTMIHKTALKNKWLQGILPPTIGDQVVDALDAKGFLKPQP